MLFFLLNSSERDIHEAILKKVIRALCCQYHTILGQNQSTANKKKIAPSIRKKVVSESNL